MRRWLVKTEPDDYSAADLEADGRGGWDGVKNALAQQHLRSMRVGDEVFVYHTGKEKAIVAVATVVRAAYPDPSDDARQRRMVDLAFEAWLVTPVPLKDIKADDSFEEFDLVRISRLSVMPVKADVWRRLERMGGGRRGA
jgi:predicted RNA-binding protein with PUA-like domain